MLYAADDIRFEVTVDSKTVALGSSLQLNLNFYGTQNISRPELPEIDGFQSRYVGPSTRISMVNGQVSTSITHIFRLLPLKTGRFFIPALSVTYKAKTYTSEPIEIEVVKGPLTQPQQQKGLYNVSDNELKDNIFLELSAEKKIAYVNELIPITVKLYVRNLAVRDIQYPQISQQGFFIEPFSKHRQYREVKNGVSFDVVEFKTIAYATRAGELSLGPARQECTLLIERRVRRRPRSLFDDFDSFFGSHFDSFFGNYERYPVRLESKQSALLIRELPSQGVPPDFNGAVGDYNFTLEASPTDIAVGDPITLKMIISGKGNFTTVSQPTADLAGNFKVYDSQAQQTEAGKVFEQVIIPKSTAVKEIPPLRFSFFNPLTEKYQTIVQGPIKLYVKKSVGQGTKVVSSPQSAAVTEQPETLGRDIIFIKDKLGSLRKQNVYLYLSPGFRIFHIVPLCLLAVIAFLQARFQRLKNDIRYARRLRAPRKAKEGMQQALHLLKAKQAAEFFDAVSKTLYQYLGDRLHLPAGAITADSVAAILTEKNVSRDTVAKLNNIFEQCDMARFAPLDLSQADREGVFRDLQEVIDALERSKL